MTQERVRRRRMNLIRAREDAGLSQEDLAELVGSQQGYISQLENCERNPGRQLAKQIAGILKCDDSYLFDEGIEPVVQAIEEGVAVG